jgi:anti-sigma B factor antagonist
MSFRITLRPHRVAMIGDAIGSMTLGDATRRFREAVQHCLDTSQVRLVVNMYEVPFIDSAGVGAIIAAHTTLTQANGRLILTRLNNRVSSILSITGVDSVLEIHAYEDSALEKLANIP